MDWLGAVAQLRAEGAAGVLITVVSVRGHAPRDPGAKLVVGTDQTWGSVGGGNLEETAIERARVMLAEGVTTPELTETRLNEHERTEHGRQCCGGIVQLLLEPMPARPAIAVFGLGHVGYELARILSRHPVQLHLIDSRPEQLDQLRLADVTEGVADVTVHRELIGEVVLDRLPRGTQVLIMTHDHAEDFALCDAALRTTRLGGIGLIGSSAKWRRFQKLLAAEGHDAATIAMITSPIGLPGIEGKDPAVIALSVAAALLSRTTRPEPVDAPTTSRPELVDAPTTSRPELVDAPTTSRPEPVEGSMRSGVSGSSTGSDHDRVGVSGTSDSIRDRPEA